jgi:hypothetical protein
MPDPGSTYVHDAVQQLTADLNSQWGCESRAAVTTAAQVPAGDAIAVSEPASGGFRR